MKTGIVINTRLLSRRVPNKALIDINGKPMLEHLIERLKPLKWPIIIAAPLEDKDSFQPIVRKHGLLQYYGYASDPLMRMRKAAEYFNLDAAVRVTHDKIFISSDDILKMYDVYMSKALDYAYSSTMTDGTAIEFISTKVLKEASETYSNVEHISYAIKSCTNNYMDVDFRGKYQNGVRLLVDFPEDVTFMQALMACAGNDCSQKDAFLFCHQNNWITNLNRLPELTIYTCAYNAEKYLEKCIQSVVGQKGFDKFEYIIVDDHSSDRTPVLAAELASRYPNVKYIRNNKNQGLASSSNVALSNARGRYIMRLDADDYFTGNDVVRYQLNDIKDRGLDAVYPNNYFGRYDKVQMGDESHHIGGTIFSTRAVNHVKFTDGLRNYEGLDFFGRARKILNIDYLNRATFFYRQSPESMSKTNLEAREITKRDIESRLFNEAQV